MNLIIFIGIPATGKSTFYFERFRNTHIRINLDMLRTRHRESILFRACLESKTQVVIDNTNPTKDDRARYIGPARDAKYKVVGYFFESRKADAVSRNQLREAHLRIPDQGIGAVHARLELPVRSEGFDALYFVRIDRDQQAFVVTEYQDEV